MSGFHRIPAIVSSIFNNVNLLEGVLAHIACPELAVGRIKTEAPGISHTIGIDLFPVSGCVVGKWIVGRNAVECTVLLLVDINAKDLPQQSGAILSVALRVPAGAAIACSNV